MSPLYKINIPEPCTENWDTMIPRDKGRHCNACEKIVVDFTGMKPFEIQQYLQLNLHNKICGRVKQQDLKSIHIFVPQSIIVSQVSFRSIFLLALLISMGTLLFSCTDQQDQQIKIEKVTVIDTAKSQANAITCSSNSPEIHTNKADDTVKVKPPSPPIIKGLLINTPVNVVGDIIIESNPNDPYNIYNVEKVPRYRGTHKTHTNDEAHRVLNDSISAFIKTGIELRMDEFPNTTGRQRISAKFTIDTQGNATDIHVRSTSAKIDAIVEEVIASLPQFTPGYKGGVAVPVDYMIPIQYVND